MSAEFEQQIIAALTDDTASADALAQLVADTEIAISEADAAAEAARVSFLDPIKSPDANKARAVMEVSQFVADRLRSLLPRLEDRYREVAGAEALTQWRTKYEALMTERDALAAQLRNVYPAAVVAISDVLGRIAAYDRRASALHQARPSGAKGRLLGPELIARGLDEFSRDRPSIVAELKLPDWRNSERALWPPPQVPASVLLANSMLPNRDPRYSADWATAKEADIAARRADEQKLMEDEAALSDAAKREYERSLPR